MLAIKEYIGNFRDLIVYKKALLLRKEIYTMIKTLKSSDRFIKNSLKKASCAVVANIAEGNGNYYYGREYDHLDIAMCKLEKCQSLMDILFIQEKLVAEKYNRFQAHTKEIARMINALMKRNEPYLSSEFKPVSRCSISLDKITSQEDTFDRVKVFRNAIKKMAGRLPKEESSNLFDQLNRAVDSVYNNFTKSNGANSGRRFQKLNYSIGSLSEIRSFLDIVVMENFITKSEYVHLDEEAGEIQLEFVKRCNNLIV
ncbi:four helix bundle protein [Neobacillus citreus]|uniref:Four helix bundle protein n=1 Tax=Neobacillus citreus TaxID=2833578 RepID=A0A942T9L3_9BACI|nr:four helix bundle protein [Neobacillus citreus]MCH6265097.1 four helix bundle protein [Neobacillus citreus]